MTILILGSDEDSHAAHIFSQLLTQGRAVEFLDTRDFPEKLSLAFDPVRQSGWVQLPSGKRLAMEEVSSVYWRNYYGVPDSHLPDPGQAYIAQNDSRSLLESILLYWPAICPTRWVNSYEAYLLHQTKPAQLAMIARLGVPVPATVVGNDAEAARQFVAKHARSIFKPTQGGAHTRALSPDELTPERLELLQYAPITLQEEIVGTNIRVFVAGEEVGACEVRTEQLDFREDAHPRILDHSLPEEIIAQSRKIAAELKLLWTGIDYRLTPDGRYIFLEANPSPMFMGFESRCSLPLTEWLVGLLIA